MTTRWIILTCAGRSTLRLAKTLAEDGFDVWAPAVTHRVTVPRMNVKRDVTTALLPGFVFADHGHLLELLEIEHLPVNPRRGIGLAEPAHADFSLFRIGERIPTIADASLDPLRRIERRRQRPSKAGRSFKPGQGVKATSGIYTGMVGTVRRSNNRVTIVCFGGLFGKVEIETSILADHEVISALQSIAA